ncbi:unnamed protein product [Heligmosomoides polygyrus]|uniref:Hva1_TUDOR domain-containing protein n=1 Tax=Heligmosomoides polygyrus TaxID=6339 RepID=A0A183FGT0_HELPZ|nr:unnamed protein product [Heligmosomoides polygyrus]
MGHKLREENSGKYQDAFYVPGDSVDVPNTSATVSGDAVDVTNTSAIVPGDAVDVPNTSATVHGEPYTYRTRRRPCMTSRRRAEHVANFSPGGKRGR